MLDDGADVRFSMVEGWWLDTGKKDELLDANRIVLGSVLRRISGAVGDDSVVVGQVVIEDGAQLVRSTVRGPAVVGADCTVVDGFVGPFTSIGDRTRVEGTEVHFSVILQDCTVRGISRMEGSLLGRNVELIRAHRRPAAHRFLLGDHSQVEIEEGR